MPHGKRRSLLLPGILLLLLGGALALSWYVENRLATAYVLRLPSGHLFLMEDPEHPALREWRRREGIDRVAGARGDDLARLLALAAWTSHLFPTTTPFPDYPPWDAAETLRRIRRGETGGFCAQYAYVFGQAAQSLGYQVRYADLASADLASSHFVPEVYLPKQRAWVVFEPQYGTGYRDERGAPLGVLDLHDFQSGRRSGAIIETPGGKPADPRRLGLYARYRYYQRNNFLSVPAFYTVRLVNGGLQWIFEQYAPPCAAAAESAGAARRDDLDFALDASPARGTIAFSADSFLKTACAGDPYRTTRVKLPPAALAAAVRKLLSPEIDFHPLDGDTSWWPVPRSAFPQNGRKKP